MATIDFDIVTSVIHKVERSIVGHSSRYSTTPHLGTSSTIDGWKWDKRYWPTDQELEAVAFAPSIWDPSIDRIPEEYFQSGYGDNEDLLLLGTSNLIASGEDIWAPKIQHGYFYSYEDEWYLYSDWYQSEIFELSNTLSGLQFLDMSFRYKPTFPIQVRQFRYDKLAGRHEIEKDLRKIVDFTYSGTDDEFIVDTDYDPPRIWLDGVYTQEVGGDIVWASSGVATSSSLSALEFAGISDGTQNQLFYLNYSPVDPSQVLEVWTYTDTTDLQQWTVISGVQAFTSGHSTEVKIDNDLGILRFGNDLSGTGAGAVPLSGKRIRVRYTPSLFAMYEPLHARDYILARTADVHPLGAPTNKGFVQISSTNIDPAYIFLTVSGIQALGSGYYPVQLGNNTARLVATVSDIANNPFEGASVSFEILNPPVGSFGVEGQTVNAFTDGNGQAFARYNTPITSEELGHASVSPIYPGDGTTRFDFEGMNEPASISGVYLYKIHQTDFALGVAETDVDDFYTDFFATEEIAGATATSTWESRHRGIHDVGVYETYSPSEISKGKKTIVLTTSGLNSIDPHTGLYNSSIFVPLHPSSFEERGTEDEPELRIVYSGILDPVGTNDTKGYMVVSEDRVRLRAYTENSRTGRRLFSNIVSLQISIPDSMNGTYYASDLSMVQSGLLTAVRNADTTSDTFIDETSGVNDNHAKYLDERLPTELSPVSGYRQWFRRTRRGDTIGFIDAAATVTGLDPGLPTIDIQDLPALIPLGFRVKSSGITLASVLDQVTYLDPNDHLPSGYWD